MGTFCPGIFGVEALPAFVQLWSWYPSFEGDLLKESIWHVISISHRWSPEILALYLFCTRKAAILSLGVQLRQVMPRNRVLASLNAIN